MLYCFFKTIHIISLFFDIRNKKIYKNTYLNILNGYLFGKSKLNVNTSLVVG